MCSVCVGFGVPLKPVALIEVWLIGIHVAVGEKGVEVAVI